MTQSRHRALKEYIVSCYELGLHKNVVYYIISISAILGRVREI